MRRKKKHPNDYPQFAFRLYDFEEKQELEDAILAALSTLNRRLKEGEKKYTKAEVIVTAMKKGLELMKKNKLRPPD